MFSLMAVWRNNLRLPQRVIAGISIGYSKQGDTKRGDLKHRDLIKSALKESALKESEKKSDQQQAVAATVRKLLFVLMAMCIFTALLIPLYDVFCEVTGINGKVRQSPPANVTFPQQSWQQPSAIPGKIDMQFVTRVGNGLAVDFSALESQQNVTSGGKYQVMFRFHNLSSQDLVAQAVPSVSPANAARHLLKLECFCFRQLTLKAGEKKDIALVYLLAGEIPRDVNKLTLAYTLFPVDTADISLSSGG